MRKSEVVGQSFRAWPSAAVHAVNLRILTLDLFYSFIRTQQLGEDDD